MAGPSYHGRTHLPGGTDPIPGLVSAGTGPFFRLLSNISISSGTVFTDVDWSAGGDIYTNDGGIQTVTHPNSAFTGSYYSADYVAHATQPLQILQAGVYDVFTRFQIIFGAPGNSSFVLAGNAIALSSSGFAIVAGTTVDWRKFATADNVFSAGYVLFLQQRIYVSSPPVYWTLEVGHTAGTLSGANPCSAEVSVHRLGDN